MEDSSKVTLRISRHEEISAVREKSVQSSINYLDNCDDEAKILDDELESARAEMGVVREENERLKMKLKLIEKDYQSLKRRFLDVFQQEANKKSKDSSSSSSPPTSHEEKEEHDLVFLSLGRRSPSEPPKNKDEKMITSKAKEDHHQQLKEDLTLGLELKYQMLSSSSSKQPEGMDAVRSTGSGETSIAEEAKESEEAAAGGGETWPPGKVLKPIKEGLDNNNNNEVSQQNHVKRARVSVRARCDAPTMNDGCQWRKYGQKISKGNPCPRAYYRCTVAPACPVRKQVQRCAEDMSILITTYEGTHSHPLAMSATAMASTTSAAASMLLSGSSTTSTQLGPGPGGASSGHHYLHGLMNFNHHQFDSSRQRQQFYMSNTSTAPAFPTITLDLTTTSPLSTSSSSSSSNNLFNRLLSSSTTRLPPTSLSFSSSSESNILPTLWNNNNNGHFPYNNNNTHQLGSFDFGSQFQGHHGHHQDPPVPQQQLLTETLTKAITSDPSFRTVIAAAISSMSSGGAGKNNQGGGGGGGESFGQNLKWCEQIPAASSSLNALTHNNNSKGCGASSYLDRTSSSNAQRGSLTLVQPLFPFSLSKGTPAAPAAANDRDELS